jgi:hypothetical protein
MQEAKVKDGVLGKLLLGVVAVALALVAAWQLPGRRQQAAGPSTEMAVRPEELPGLHPGRGVVAHSVQTEEGNTILDFSSDGVRRAP